RLNQLEVILIRQSEIEGRWVPAVQYDPLFLNRSFVGRRQNPLNSDPTPHKSVPYPCWNRQPAAHIFQMILRITPIEKDKRLDLYQKGLLLHNFYTRETLYLF